MAERREREEFYEAMPGTMQGTRYQQRESAVDNELDEGVEARRSWLPWLLIPAAILLGWLLLNALGNNNSGQNNTNTGSNATQQGTTGTTGSGTNGSLTQ